MRWPQIAVIVMFVMKGLIAFPMHKKPQQLHAPIQIAHILLLAWLLWMGGFFSHG